MADYDRSFVVDVACVRSVSSTQVLKSRATVKAWSKLSIKGVLSDAEHVSKGCARSTTTMHALYEDSLLITNS